MRKFQRPATPQALVERGAQWTATFVARRAADAGAKFAWPQYNTVPLNQILSPILLSATDQHCAYCDKFPLFTSDETIDHFKPKSSYPEDAFTWTNLFPACDSCQSKKMEQYEDSLLSPEQLNFDFNRYFYVDYTTFELKPNPAATEEDFASAELTIRIFGLAQAAHNISRGHEFERHSKSDSPVLHDYAYRYLFD